MFTVRDALDLEVLRGAHVAGGSTGLGREVRWAHVVDVPDVSRWVRGGELVLTTAVSLRDDPLGQRTLVPDLNGKDLAGLILATGGYLQRAPPEMTAQADRLAFPVIELAWDIPFEDVTMAVSERIVNAQNSLLRRSAEIHDRLTARVLQGGEYAELAADLADVLARPVLILDAAFHHLAHYSPRRSHLLTERAHEGRLPRLLVEYLQESMTREGQSGVPRAWRAAARPEVGLLMDCVLAPVAVGKQTLGYILAGSARDTMDNLDVLAAERAATVAALLMYKERAVRMVEQRLEGSLLDRLLGGGPIDGALSAAARRFGLDSSAQYAVALLSPGENDPALLAPLVRTALARMRQPRLFGELSFCLALVLDVREHEAATLAQRLVDEIAAPQPLRLALGRRVAFDDLARSYAQAGEALEAARRLNLQDPVVVFDELGLLHWLNALPQEARSDNIFARKIRLLAQYEEAKAAGLVASLECYLHHDGAVSEAAAALGVHRHTLTYRLDKIEKVCELDLSAPLVRLNLQVALLEYRLHG